MNWAVDFMGKPAAVTLKVTDYFKSVQPPKAEANVMNDVATIVKDVLSKNVTGAVRLSCSAVGAVSADGKSVEISWRCSVQPVQGFLE